MAVRRESVRLELEDNFSKKMLAAAAATQALQSSLSDLDGTSVSTGRSLDRTSKDTDSLSRSAVAGSREIDKFSGRLGIMLRVAGALGPVAGALGAVGVAGAAALASQLGFAAVGVSSLIVAFQGMGDAFKAVNEASIEPTAANLQAARDALEGLDPAAQAFVHRFQEFRPVLAEIRNSAQAGLFPGLTESLDSLEKIAPKVGDIMEAVGAVGGTLIAEGAEALAGPEWAEFMDFIAAEAPPALEAMGRSVGNLAEGMADLWMAFDPLSDGMSDWMLEGSRGFAEWADGLAETQGFQEFLAYVRENGPLVGDAFVAIANAVLQIAEAAAPLGGPVLRAITGIANAIAFIADSPLGPPIMAAVTALSAFSIAANIATASATRLKTSMTLLAANPWAAVATAAVISFMEIRQGAEEAAAAIDGDMTDAMTEFEHRQETMTDPFAWITGEAGRTAASDFYTLLTTGELASTTLAREAASWGTTGESMMDVLDRAGVSFDEARNHAGGFAGAVHEVRDAAHTTNAEIRGLTDAMLENANAALGAFDAVTQYREALNAARAQGEKSNEGIEGNSEAALENRNVLSQLAAAWDNQSAAVRNNVEKQREAHRTFIETATAMGVPIDRAIELADTLLSIPRSTTVALEVEDKASAKIIGVQRLIDYYGLTKAQATALLADLASGKIGNVQQLINRYGLTKAEATALLHDAASGPLNNITGILNNLDGKTANTYVITHYQSTRAEEHVPHASGGTVMGMRQPYGDRVRAILAPGEEVISNRYGQADRHRQLLKAINANRYADGGTMRSERPAGSSSRMTVNIKADDFRGSISTPWGTLDLRSAIRAEAQDVYDQGDNFKRTQR